MRVMLRKSRLLRCSFATTTYDVAVIGGGPGGYVAAIKAAQEGMNVVCIEKRGALGGTCLNVGCIPSKALLNISQKYYESKTHFKAMGINVGDVSMDWAQAQKNKDGIVTSLTKGIEMLFKKNKAAYLKGSGAFLTPNTIEITSNEGKSTIEAKNIIIATGSEPSPFPGLPFDEKIILSSTGALSLPKIPKNMIVIGGGVIGLEMGSVFQRLGTKVTVLEYFDQICSVLDKEISKSFNKILTKQGLKILTSHKVISGKNHGTHAQITFENIKSGQRTTLQTEHILIATGRKPHTYDLGLDKIGLKLDEKGRVVVNDYLQTQVKNVYGIGDVVRGAMLAHKSQQQGIFVIEHILGRQPHLNYNAIPSVIYTHPEIAAVGHTQQQLIAQKIQYKKGVFPFLANSRAKAISDTDGMVKILADKHTDRLLGAHIIGPGAGEMISEAVIGLEYGASSEDLARTCHAHPTLSEAFKEACMSTYDKPIHF